MRILFSAVLAHGHVLPMMPVARAAMSAGHEVSLLTHGALSELADPVPVLAAGPTFDELSGRQGASDASFHRGWVQRTWQRRQDKFEADQRSERDEPDRNIQPAVVSQSFLQEEHEVRDFRCPHGRLIRRCRLLVMMRP
jgi:UDP:flavonoid glycosyltransferase YjiC (YdhE family)